MFAKTAELIPPSPRTICSVPGLASVSSCSLFFSSLRLGRSHDLLWPTEGGRGGAASGPHVGSMGLCGLCGLLRSLPRRHREQVRAAVQEGQGARGVDRPGRPSQAPANPAAEPRAGPVSPSQVSLTRASQFCWRQAL